MPNVYKMMFLREARLWYISEPSTPTRPLLLLRNVPCKTESVLHENVRRNLHNDSFHFFLHATAITSHPLFQWIQQYQLEVEFCLKLGTLRIGQTLHQRCDILPLWLPRYAKLEQQYSPNIFNGCYYIRVLVSSFGTSECFLYHCYLKGKHALASCFASPSRKYLITNDIHHKACQRFLFELLKSCHNLTIINIYLT